MIHLSRRWMVLVLVLFAASGCARKEETALPAVPPAELPGLSPGIAPYSGSPPAGQAEAIERAQLDAVEPATTPRRLALVVKTRNNPFFTPMIEAAERTAAELGVELEVQAPPQESDKERQFSMVQDVAAKGVAAILIAPADSRGIVPALKQAQEQGILIINVDNRIDASTARAAGLELGGYVGADNEEGGRLAGEAMVEALGGSGGVALLEGIRGADNAEARKRGFQTGIGDDLELVVSDTAEWDTQKAYAKFQSMLAAHPALQGLFCANDKMALGALQAIEEARRTGDLIVIGYDNIPDVRAHLQNGELYATIEQHPELMGEYGVRMAVGILAGSVPRGREYLVPLEVIGRNGV